MERSFEPPARFEQVEPERGGRKSNIALPEVYPLFTSPIAMGRRPIAFARVLGGGISQEGRAMKSPPF